MLHIGRTVFHQISNMSSLSPRSFLTRVSHQNNTCGPWMSLWEPSRIHIKKIHITSWNLNNQPGTSLWGQLKNVIYFSFINNFRLISIQKTTFNFKTKKKENPQRKKCTKKSCPVKPKVNLSKNLRLNFLKLNYLGISQQSDVAPTFNQLEA